MNFGGHGALGEPETGVIGLHETPPFLKGTMDETQMLDLFWDIMGYLGFIWLVTGTMGMGLLLVAIWCGHTNRCNRCGELFETPDKDDFLCMSCHRADEIFGADRDFPEAAELPDNTPTHNRIGFHSFPRRNASRF